MTRTIQILHLMRRLRPHVNAGQLDCWAVLQWGLVMRDFASLDPGVPFLTQTAANSLDQIHDRVLSEVKSHERRAAQWDGGAEPNVELTLEEARIMAANLTRAARLLRIASEESL